MPYLVGALSRWKTFLLQLPWHSNFRVSFANLNRFQQHQVCTHTIFHTDKSRRPLNTAILPYWDYAAFCKGGKNSLFFFFFFFPVLFIWWSYELLKWVHSHHTEVMALVVSQSLFPCKSIWCPGVSLVTQEVSELEFGSMLFFSLTI